MRAFHLLRHPRQRRTLEGPIHSILGVLALLALVLALVVAPVPPSGAQPTLSCLADPAGDATGALDITLHCTTTTSDGVSLSVTFAGSPVIADLNGVRIWVGPGGEDRSVDLTLDPGDGTLVAQVNSMFQLETVCEGLRAELQGSALEVPYVPPRCIPRAYDPAFATAVDASGSDRVPDAPATWAPAAAMATTPFRDLTATDRIEATLAWSRATFPDAGVREVLIGREDLFADALAAGGIQASWFIPFLITHATTLDPRVRAELQRLAPGRVTILGGTDAVSGAVEADLNSMGYVVRRAAGPSRLETAVDAAQLFTPVPGRTGFGRYGIVVRAFGGPGGDESQAFADAIGMGSLPAARRDPVVLTQTDVLSTPSRTLLDHGDPTFGVRIVGGPAAVSGAVEAELGTFRNGVERIAGPTRFDTAIAALAVQGMNSAGDVDRVILVEGQAADAWAPGFAAIANASAGLRHAVVLANGPTLPAATQVWLGGVNPADRPELICAPLVDPVTCNAARGILGV